MKATPLKGTRDYLPKEVRVRDFLQNTILEVYQDAGFSRITTPALEDAVNLDKSDGGENLNLIFRILKRGQKLTNALQDSPVSEKDLSDLGLRYDLTLPLSRYFAAHRNELFTPFKVIQMDRVYRAERPQKGRLREFMQCDIDIVGNPDADAEVDLILTTAKALKKIGIEDFKVKINDRRILKSVFSFAGFSENAHEKIAVILDKLDKIGLMGVRSELQESGFSEEMIEKLLEVFQDGSVTLDSVSKVCNEEYTDNLKMIMETVEKASEGKVVIEYSPSLVRGQGYYTGTIFEVEAEGYQGAVAGGGRYDHLIGKFTNEEIPAVGFSIGFERIFSILMENGCQVPGKKKKIAVFSDAGQYVEAAIYAETLRKQSMVSLFTRPKKLGKFLGKLEANGFDGYLVFGEGDTIKEFAKNKSEG